VLKLHPFLDFRIQNINDQHLTKKVLYDKRIREVDKVSRNSQLWVSTAQLWDDYHERKNDPNFKVDKFINSKDNFTYKAWHKYHRERFKKTGNNKYKYTDEKMVAAAITEAFLCNKEVVILTQDSDLSIILFQFRNNLIWLQASSQMPEDYTEPYLWETYYKLCEDYNSWYILERDKRYLSVLQFYKDNDIPIDFNRLAIECTQKRDITILFLEKNKRDINIFPKCYIEDILNKSGIVKRYI
jgi:predicted nuclease of predicted toxin-antitoxin system